MAQIKQQMPSVVPSYGKSITCDEVVDSFGPYDLDLVVARLDGAQDEPWEPSALAQLSQEDVPDLPHARFILDADSRDRLRGVEEVPGVGEDEEEGGARVDGLGREDLDGVAGIRSSRRRHCPSIQPWELGWSREGGGAEGREEPLAKAGERSHGWVVRVLDWRNPSEQRGGVRC